MVDDAPGSPLGEPDRRLIRTEEQSIEAVRAGKTPQQQEADDRSWIVKWVVGGFCGYISLIVLTLGLRAWFSGSCDDAVAIEVELLKTAIMPLMTLVLGYFFSRPNR